MLRSAVPPRDARAGAATAAAATCSQEARGDLELRSCADPYCRRGLFCAFRCKHCARDFCEEHRQAEAHSCAAAHTADRRVLTCDDCGQVVQERETLAHAADPAARQAYEALAARARDARADVLAVVRSALSAHAERRANLHSFWAASGEFDEAEAMELVPAEMREHWEGIEREKSSSLLALHMHAACRARPGAVAAPAAAAAKPSKGCGMKRCKSKCSSAFLQHCKKCDRHFCLPHRLPEVHGCT